MKMNITERLLALEMLNGMTGNYATLKVVRTLQDELGFSDKEIEEYGMKFEGTDVKWDDKADTGKDIDFGTTGTELIQNNLKSMDTSGTLTQQHMTLYEKFMEE